MLRIIGKAQCIDCKGIFVSLEDNIREFRAFGKTYYMCKKCHWKR